MKKKMAIVLSFVLACSMNMTTLAAASATVEASDLSGAQTNSTTNTVVITDQEVSVPGSTAQSTLAQSNNVGSDKVADLPGTQYMDEDGNFVDSSNVQLVVTPGTLEETQEKALDLAAAMTSNKVQIYNYTGTSSLSLLDSDGNLNVLKYVRVSLQDQDGNLLSHNGAVAPAFVETDLLGNAALDENGTSHGLYQGAQTWNTSQILGGRTLKAGETLQALYKRADGSWAALPIVMRDGVVAVSIPAFSGEVDIVFVIAKGESKTDVSPSTTRSPAT